jgi:hypothetical protein
MSSAHAPAGVSGRQSPAWGRLLWGLALLGAGSLWLLDASDLADITYPKAIAIALIGLGVVVPFVPTRDHGGVIGLGVVLVVLALVTVVAGPAANPTLLRRGAGDVTVAPTAAEQVRQRYEHGVGDLTVDLRRVAFPAGTTRTSIHLGAGQLRVRLPNDVSARVRASAGLGDVVVLEHKRSGIAPSFDGEIMGRSAERVLDLEVAVGLGRIEVTR